MSMQYVCDTCNEVRSIEDKRIIRVVKIVKDEEAPARKDIDTCVHCMARGLVVTSTFFKIMGAE